MKQLAVSAGLGHVSISPLIKDPAPPTQPQGGGGGEENSRRARGCCAWALPASLQIRERSLDVDQQLDFGILEFRLQVLGCALELQLNLTRLWHGALFN